MGHSMNLLANNGFSYNLLKHPKWVGEVNYNIYLASGAVGSSSRAWDLELIPFYFFLRDSFFIFYVLFMWLVIIYLKENCDWNKKFFLQFKFSCSTLFQIDQKQNKISISLGTSNVIMQYYIFPCKYGFKKNPNNSNKYPYKIPIFILNSHLQCNE